jgi:hypothetical protein
MPKNGKLKATYNSIKPTKRQEKKQKQHLLNEELTKEMVVSLENKVGNKVKYNCEHCLKTAYNKIITGCDTNGYISDEEVLESIQPMISGTKKKNKIIT